MVWAAIGFNGTIDIVFVEWNINSSEYQKLISLNLFLNAADITGDSWIFQQDIGPAHNSRSTMSFFDQNSVKVLD